MLTWPLVFLVVGGAVWFAALVCALALVERKAEFHFDGPPATVRKVPRDRPYDWENVA